MIFQFRDLPTICAEELRGVAARMRDRQLPLFEGAAE